MIPVAQMPPGSCPTALRSAVDFSPVHALAV